MKVRLFSFSSPLNFSKFANGAQAEQAVAKITLLTLTIPRRSSGMTMVPVLFLKKLLKKRSYCILTIRPHSLNEMCLPSFWREPFLSKIPNGCSHSRGTTESKLSVRGGKNSFPIPPLLFTHLLGCPLRGRADDFYHNIKSVQLSNELSLRSALVLSK